MLRRGQPAVPQPTALMRFDGFIQVAGIIDQLEAELLIDCGVEYLGFPLRLPVHREDLTEADAAVIVARLAAPVRAIVITYLDRADDVLALCGQLGATIVQLHGDIEADELAELANAAPDLVVIKSLVVRDGNRAALERTVEALSPHVAAFITDTYDPATGASGATGKTHDWSVSRHLVEISARPVILAGGLTPRNVREAVVEVRPAGVDTHTGVEGTDGRKTRALVRAFVDAARAGFADLAGEA